MGSFTSDKSLWTQGVLGIWGLKEMMACDWGEGELEFCLAVEDSGRAVF